MKFNKTQTKKLLSFKRYLEKFFDGKTLTCLSHQTIMTMIDCYNEIVTDGKTIASQKDVANKFLNKGFKVTLDKDNINYIITI